EVGPGGPAPRPLQDVDVVEAAQVLQDPRAALVLLQLRVPPGDVGVGQADVADGLAADQDARTCQQHAAATALPVDDLQVLHGTPLRIEDRGAKIARKSELKFPVRSSILYPRSLDHRPVGDDGPLGDDHDAVADDEVVPLVLRHAAAVDDAHV